MDKPKSDFRMVMEAKGYTVDDLVRRCGLSSSLISKLCNGARSVNAINLDTLLSLCEAFEMSPNELLYALRISYYHTGRANR